MVEGGIWQGIAQVSGGGTTTYADSGVDGQVSSSYRVDAFNDAGASDPSEPASFPVPPSPPDVLSAITLSSSAVELVWVVNEAYNETGFYVQTAPPESTDWTTLATIPAGTTSYIDSTLSPNEIKHYRVLAYNTDGVSIDNGGSNYTVGTAAPPYAEYTGLPWIGADNAWPLAAVPLSDAWNNGPGEI